MRVLDMRGIDLTRWRFDWDLTFTALAVHPDGTILHRYGGRDVRDADRWLTTDSYARFLEAGLKSHASHQPVKRQGPTRLVLEEIPRYAKKDKGECIHCHMVNPSLREHAQDQGSWRDRDLWVYPPPGRVGLDLDRDDQQLVTAVAPDSAAAAAGVKVGDRITRVGEVAVATASDLMHGLHELPWDGGEASVQLSRGPVTLTLAPGWKRGSPAAFAWRPSKWGMSPAPGFGGPQLKAGELERLGLAEDTFAFRVNYLVTWGDKSHLGRHAARSGLRKNQIVLGTSAKRDFESVQHFHSWWRLTQKVDGELEVILWQDGEERRLPWKVIE